MRNVGRRLGEEPCPEAAMKWPGDAKEEGKIWRRRGRVSPWSHPTACMSAPGSYCRRYCSRAGGQDGHGNSLEAREGDAGNGPGGLADDCHNPGFNSWVLYLGESDGAPALDDGV